jgi:hypothetical protein
VDQHSHRPSPSDDLDMVEPSHDLLFTDFVNAEMCASPTQPGPKTCLICYLDISLPGIPLPSPGLPWPPLASPSPLPSLSLLFLSQTAHRLLPQIHIQTHTLCLLSGHPMATSPTLQSSSNRSLPNSWSSLVDRLDMTSGLSSPPSATLLEVLSFPNPRSFLHRSLLPLPSLA